MCSGGRISENGSAVDCTCMENCIRLAIVNLICLAQGRGVQEEGGTQDSRG